MNFNLFSTDDGPPALGFDAAHGGVALGSHVSHTIAVGHLVEAVFGGDRADLYRLK